MNPGWKSINPIELIRLSEKTSQEDFAEKLRFSGKDNYRYHAVRFTPRIIKVIRELYDVDLTADVIDYLRNEIRSLKKDVKALKKSLKEEKHSGPKPESSAADIISSF